MTSLLARMAAALAALLLPAFALAQTPTPAPGATKESIARGAYLARVGDCVSCHSSSAGGQFGGGLRIDTPFGYLLSPNITFDKTTGIGTWSRDDFWEALHNGYSRRAGYLYPAMPFTFFTKATRADVDAIYDFLSTVQPQTYPVDVNHLDFPFNVRMSMIGWNALYFTPGSYVADPAHDAVWNRGAYLITGLGHCAACHEPRNAMGAVERSAGMTGAKIGDWFASNITPNRQSGLGTWSVQDVVTFLKNGQNAHITAEGPMAEVVHNSLKYMTDDDLTAMATYLKDLPAATSTVGPAAVAFDRARAGALFADTCAPCHGPQGAGRPAQFGGGPPLADNPLVVAADPTNVVRATVGGLNAHFGRFPMAAQLNGVSARQLADIINYVRTSWGNTAAPNATAQMVFQMQGQLAPQ